MEPQSSPKLLELPPEVLLHTLAFTTTQDCARVATVNRVLNVLCSTWTLYRDLLSRVSDPTPPGPDFPFQLHCRRFFEATVALERIHQGLPPPSDVLSLLETLVHLATSRPPAGVPSLNEVFLEKHLSPNASHILTLHPTFSSRHLRLRSEKNQSTPKAVKVSELVSRLHALSTPSLAAVSSPLIRTSAREIVYERLNFTRTSEYGPLQSDSSGKVDWRKIEALSIVMSANLDEAKSMGWGQESGDEDDETIVPHGWGSTRTGSASAIETTETTKKNPRDWAGIEDFEWRGTYAFLHYPVYHHYNQHRTSTYIPSLGDESEAVGDCMSLKLELLPEGVEMSPPLEAFRARTGVATGRGRPPADSDDDSEDFDFDIDANDEGDTSSSAFSSDDEDGAMHYVTNQSARSQPQGATPPTSPPEDNAEISHPIGPLPPSSSSSDPTPSLLPSRPNAYPKLSFRGSSMPLQLRPQLAFTGTFLNHHAHFNIQDRSIRGTVEMNADGEVIWKYVIRYGGQDHWAMTGVQVGGPKSKYGVVGSWTCADREAADDEGPNGPFWYWPNMPAV